MPTDSAWINLGCGDFRAPHPWTNVDVRDDVGADRIITEDQAADLPSWLAPGSVSRLYCGHLIEHNRWPEGVAHLLGSLDELLDPLSGEVCFVAPDVKSMVEAVHDGAPPSLVYQAWEDDRSYGLNAGTLARHHWDCYAERLQRACELWAPFMEWTFPDVHPSALGAWPVVSFSDHQCAAIGRRHDTGD